MSARLLFVNLACLLTAVATAAAGDPPPITELLVRLRPGVVTASAIGELVHTTATREAGRLHYRPVVRLALDGQDPETTAARLAADPRVAYVEPNTPVTVAAWASDPAVTTLQWGFRRIGGPRALALLAGRAMDPSVLLAIVDTGIDERHPELGGRLLPGHDFLRDSATTRDNNGHGTHVAAIAAATTGNHLGIAAPFAGKLLPVRVLGSRGSGSVGDVADGIDYAAARGARVINLSLGAPYDSRTLEDAVRDAWTGGALVVAAAGNAGGEEQLYPAGYNDALSVSAWGFADHGLADFASYHRTVELTAPGEHIYSAFLQGGYQLLSGSSMAAPFVSGVAAALLAARPDLSNACLRHLLQETAEELRTPGRDDKTGYGMVRFDLAVERLDSFTCP
ncbi:MAG: alkaline serine protease [Nitrospirae bacterium CG18_big_fil_WC_8_21_14_2_50_70_55]|nr:S8 family serine peptidase [Deltaproteobacteria bacterium]OIP62179.1 MAG: hypothetical protein AUK30_10635 [Nitrospirae bacterium CG2_30_70_394]PIQ06315.1 MAG: alkaline serine protease [Nitrospirae bacterium CG18_big_fil_WC_8_21_14_2_50_70_55]PIU77606.1 MAG: peptidase S8 [Nitrospirae bacterium CG06_land_8_20_14_3_00_70_43]PIW82002.1 MAG: peptidase S8 [Nitrospirae bacterium CG_4_8_14_3_um_filter_70_85]PIX84450.1 MAG: peptidase S8 [Nitrospirae bacterium CG_4_10_14_3_um_filter_70_108]PJB97158